jgi:hypothetical protein
MGLGGRQLAATAQAIDQGGGLAADGVQQVAAGIALGIRHRDTPLRQMLHQVQVKRQLLEGQALEWHWLGEALEEAKEIADFISERGV